METLIVFLIVFVPFGWYMWVTLRFTRDTIGTNSPMKVPRFYKTTVWSYFVRSENLFVFYAIVGGAFLIRISLFSYISYTVDYQGLLRLLIFGFAVFLFICGLLILAVDLNHWNYAKDVTVETFPDKHELEIAFQDVVLRLRDGDIEKIVVYHNNGAKLVIEYAKCFLTNGDHFVVPGKLSGQWVVIAYFKNVPIEYIIQRFPFIR